MTTQILTAAAAIGAVGTLVALALLLVRFGRYSGLVEEKLTNVAQALERLREELRGQGTSLHGRVTELTNQNSREHRSIIQEASLSKRDFYARLSVIERNATCLHPDAGNRRGGEGG